MVTRGLSSHLSFSPVHFVRRLAAALAVRSQFPTEVVEVDLSTAARPRKHGGSQSGTSDRLIASGAYTETILEELLGA